MRVEKACGEASFSEELELTKGQIKAIALTGGGGKTSLLFCLAEELCHRGKKVILTTTTHMAYEEDLPFAAGGEAREVAANLDAFGYTMTAEWDGISEKVSGLSEEKLKVLLPLCDVLLIEADGAKRMPIKVPEKWEPVIPDFTELVIAVAGLDCIEKPINETAHRPERVASFLGKSTEEILTFQDMETIVTSSEGLKKGVGKRAYRIYFNKADLLLEKKELAEMAGNLCKKGYFTTYGSLREGWIKKGEER